MSNLPDPMVEVFDVELPAIEEQYRYDMDPEFHARVRRAHVRMLHTFQVLRRLMDPKEERLFKEKLLWLSIHLVADQQRDFRL